MSTLNFPTSPSLNDTYSFGTKTWVWNGDAWQLQSSGAINNIPIGNVTPSTGAFTTLSATGNITGNYFIGNGSQLTGISSDTVGGTFNVVTRSGLLAITVTSGFFSVTTRSSGALKVAVS